MVILNLKLERQQRLPPSQLLYATLIITVLLSSLSRFHDLTDLTYSKCSSYFSDADIETILLQRLVLSPVPAVVSTSLASQQSYGLFDDIPDQRWELMRKRAHEEHTHVQKPKIQYDNKVIENLSNLEVR
jgi:hypothetical protein